MSISFHNALGLYESALSLRAGKAAVLSANLANSDTPGFKARDVNFQQELKKKMSGNQSEVKIRASRPGHIGFGEGSPHQSEKLYRIPHQPSIDGNTVEEHVEHAAFMENSLEFQAAFIMLNGRFKGLTKAVRGD